jgi:hypothetical protein
MIDDLIYHFVDWCLKLKHEWDAVMALYIEVHEEMQETNRAIKDHLFLLSPCLLCILHHSASNASDIPLNMNTNVLIFISD